MGSHAGKNRALIAFALVGATGVRTAHAAAPTIYNLGTLGGSQSYGNAINASGQVAGSSWMPGDAAWHAFLYTGTPGGGGAMHDLGTLGGSQSYGNAINASGQVAGTSGMAGDVTSHAFRYTGTPGGGGAMADLGTVDGAVQSDGYGINDSGQVAGTNLGVQGLANFAFRYTGTPGNGGAMADLGPAERSGQDSYGYAINNSGQVAGEAGTLPFGDHFRAIRYTGTPGSGGVWDDLGVWGHGRAINASGQVAGYSELSDVAIHAFLYTGTPGSGGTMADLGTLGGPRSFGYAINDGGQVAGYSEMPGNSAWHAFLYTGTPGVNGRMIDLDAWLDANNPAEGSKWNLAIAFGMNDGGLITGDGYYDDGPGGLSDGRRAFILDASSLIPEPGGLTLLGLGGITLLGRRRRGSAVAGTRRMIKRGGSLFGRSMRTIHRPPFVFLTTTTAAAAVAALGVSTSAGPASAAVPVYGPPADSGHVHTPGQGVRSVNESGTAVGFTDRRAVDELNRAYVWNSTSAAELGRLVFGGYSYVAFGVNDAGTVVGDLSFTVGSFGHSYAVRWDSAGVPVQLDSLGAQSVTGLTSAAAYAINASGTAVGEARDYAGSRDLGIRPVRWDPSGTAITQLANLGTNSLFQTQCTAGSINDAGTIAGIAMKYDVGGNELGYRAVRWDTSGAITELGHLGTDAGGATEANGIAINRAGTIVGAALKDGTAAEKGWRPVRWDASGTAATELGNLGADALGVTDSQAYAVNDAGTVAGFARKHVNDVDLGKRAVRWDASGTAAVELGNLGTAPTGHTEAEAFAINAGGIAVGHALDYDDLGNLPDDLDGAGNLLAQHAVYWGPDGVAVDLNTLIDPAGAWTLRRATDISDSGWITGDGSFDPDGPGGGEAYARAFTLQVPEPGGLALLGFAVPVLLRRRARRTKKSGR